MSCQDDLDLARALQAEYDRESAQELDTNEDILFDPTSFSDPPAPSNYHHGGPVVSGNETMSIVDKRWELLDPSPDVRSMFMEFNERYFWGRLAGVEVRWSPRMTLCAGLCCYEGRGGLCSIRLSTPLLKLRPRKDLVETLLHEMIHAYLFVTDNNKDHDGHGPEFCKHMKRLNTATGTNITIYHTFHDEVENYRQHWWKCNGPCQKKPPYFGIVKRAMNRAPAPRDTWWAEHQRNCGGTYTKIKEPEGYGEKKKGSKRKNETGSEDSDIENGAKRRATDGSGTAPERFPGKGNVLGSGASSKQPTPLQKWIADQRNNQNGSSTSTSKTKPPASLGAPPPQNPHHSSNPDESSKQNQPELTPLQKWLAKIEGKTKNSTSTPPSTSSTSATGAVQGTKNTQGAKNKDNRPKNKGISKDTSGKQNGKHVRKGSGNRQKLLAIFDSDSDSDDFFPATRRTTGSSSGVNSSPVKAGSSGSRNGNASSSKATGIFPGNSSGSIPSKNKTSGAFNRSDAPVSGNLHLPSVRPKRDNSGAKVPSPNKHHNPARPVIDSTSRSKVISPGHQQTPWRPNMLKANVPSPSKQQNPISNGITGAFADTRQGSGNPGSSGSVSSYTGHTGGAFGSNVTVPTHDLTGSVWEQPGLVGTQTVPCPVCGTKVPETTINIHLDMCLT